MPPLLLAPHAQNSRFTCVWPKFSRGAGCPAFSSPWGGKRARASPTSGDLPRDLISPGQVPACFTSPFSVPKVGHLKLPAAPENLDCFPAPPGLSPRTVWASRAEEGILFPRTDLKSAFCSPATSPGSAGAGPSSAALPILQIYTLQVARRLSQVASWSARHWGCQKWRHSPAVCAVRMNL